MVFRVGKMEKIFRALIAKERVSDESAVNLRYLRVDTKRAFRWFLLRRGSFFRLKGFHPFLEVYLHFFALFLNRLLL